MKKQEKQEVDQMMLNILAHIGELSNEECSYHIELTQENATQFFTALNNAVCHLLCRTGMAENLLSAQHIYNKLLFQYLNND